MNTTQRILGAAAAAVAVVAVAVPAASGTAAEEQWPPPSTHGRFLPVPPETAGPQTFAACGDEVTVAPGDVDETEYRVLVAEDGSTVLELRGAATADITRASDGAMLDEIDLSGRTFETYSADGTQIGFDSEGASLVIAFDEVEAAAFAAAGLPAAFVFLDGTVEETVTFASAPQPGEVPSVVSAEVTENTAEYVFDLCHLLDQAADGA